MTTRNLLNILLTITLVYCSAAVSRAAEYDFVQDGTGVVLATLTTDTPTPFNHMNVVSLDFTIEGDAIFGFGIGEYSGTFDFTNAAGEFFVSDGSGGLAGQGVDPWTQFVDADPPSTIFNPVPVTPRFVIQANVLPSFFTVGGFLGYDDAGILPQEFVIVEGGFWVTSSDSEPLGTPEPTTFTLALLGLLILTMTGRRRRRR